jgi:hypothetical protein
MADDRPVRGCEVCGGVDDHPRHVVGVAEGGVPSDEIVDKIIANGASAASIRMVMDPSTVVRHMDCCAGVGCPDGSCNTIHAIAPGDETLRGEALLAHLQTDAVSRVGQDIHARRLDEAAVVEAAEAAAQGGE